MYKEIYKCRICGNDNLISLINLGNLTLTGVFPKSKNEIIESGPLELIKCIEDEKGQHCGLVQLKHSYELDKLYSDNYGYRSGLNRSMVEHLHAKVKKILSFVELSRDDLIIDIGSNDSTTLQAYPEDNLTLVGIDPTGKKFKKYYPPHINLIPDFFSANKVMAEFGNKKAKIITSIAMFYDLEDPIAFMEEIYDVLADDGIWVFEQSYLPAMLAMNAYDTICHEHLEYYAFKQIKYMIDRVNFKIIDVEFNDVNGGSFSVMVAKKDSHYKENTFLIDKIITEENEKGLSTLKPYQDFKDNTLKHKDDLLSFFHKMMKEGKTIFGYGASTKGNVILQFCNLTEKNIPYIAEVNEDKFGSYTPGTLIPIISEKEAKKMNPDYFMVLPWHFKANIINKEKEYLNAHGRLFFPLPFLDIISK